MRILQWQVAMTSDNKNPSEADIAERVRLLRKACTVTAHPDDAPGLGGFHFAAYEDGPYYLQERDNDAHIEGAYTFQMHWKIVGLDEFSAELERVAIRQLLAERGGK